MGRNGKLSLDEVLERLNALMVNPNIKFEETEEQKQYLDEKKKVYYLQFSNGYRVYNGVDFVRLSFKEETSRRVCNNVMSEAEASNNRYQDLLNAEFQEKHGIEAVEVIEIDQKIMLEEKIRYVGCNTETGEDEEVTIQEDDFNDRCR